MPSLRYFLIFIFGLCFLYVGIAFFFGRIDFNVRPSIISKRERGQFYDYAGVINVHSAESSGSGDLEKIAESAHLSGLDFVVITDTNNFSSQLKLQSYFGNVLILVGGEYSFLDSRILNVGFQSAEHLSGPGRAQVVLSDLLDKTERPSELGFFVLAHPFKAGYAVPSPLPPGLDGIEVFNLKSVWQSAWLNKRSSFFLALFLYPINIQWSFTRLFASYTRPETAMWDKENEQRRLIGFAGADADAKTRSPFGGHWEFPSYQTSFSILRNHILIRSELTGQIEQDRQKVLAALRSGSFYMSLDLIGNAKGFDAHILDKTNKAHPMGSTLSLRQADKLIITLPEKPLTDFEVTVFQDGTRLLASNSVHTEVALHTPGSYRATVRVLLHFPFEGPRWVEWILTNPFYVTP